MSQGCFGVDADRINCETALPVLVRSESRFTSELILIKLIVKLLCQCLQVVNGGCFGVKHWQSTFTINSISLQ